MPKIRLHGIETMLRKMNKNLSDLHAELPKRYAEAADKIGAKIASDAKNALNKPNWELSRAIISRQTKIYKEGKFVFKAVEVIGSKDARPNTPGGYVFFQEHGWFVNPNTVRRPDKDRLVYRGKRFKKATGYKKQEGKKFFQTAFLANESQLRAEIDRINKEAMDKIKNA